MKLKGKIHWGAIIFTIVNAFILACIIEIYPIPKFKVTLTNYLNIDYVDLIVILVTCLGVLIAALTIFIAILAFVGLRQMKVAAVSSAEEHVKKSIIEDDGDLNRIVKQEIDEITYQHLRGTEIADDWPDNDENGDT
jgi:hypothetical protein